MHCPHCHGELAASVITLIPIGPTPEKVTWQQRVEGHLTPTEMRTLHLAIDGLTYKQIGLRLGLRNSQVINARMSHICGKLGVKTRGELMRLCFGGYR